jgi:Amt family ammonium transporter
MVVMLAVNAMGLLRISAEGENYGLDLHEHGISAYPEYVISSTVTGAAVSISPGSNPLPSGATARVGLSPGQQHI